jgi:hypothetical protein
VLTEGRVQLDCLVHLVKLGLLEPPEQKAIQVFQEFQGLLDLLVLLGL